MAHLELLLQKGDIPGPPYIMPDALEFTFMRGFLDRQRRGIPHNPRIRALAGSSSSSNPSGASDELDEGEDDGRGSPESPSLAAGPAAHMHSASPLRSPVASLSFREHAGGASASLDLPRRIEASRASLPPHTHDKNALPDSLLSSTESSLRQARARLKQARLASREALARFSECTDHERTLEAEVTRSEERLDELIAGLLIPSAAAASHNPPNANTGSGGGGSSAAGPSVPIVASMSTPGPSLSTAGAPGGGGDPNGYDLRGVLQQHQHPHPHQQQRSSYAAPHTPTQTQASYAWYPQRPVSTVSTGTLDLGEGPGGSSFSEVGMGGAGGGAGGGEGKEMENWGGEKLDEVRSFGTLFSFRST